MKLMFSADESLVQLVKDATFPYSVMHLKGKPLTIIYNAGTRIYQLTSDKKMTYIMYASSQMVDKTLQLSDLEHLGDRLKVPNGWVFSTVLLREELSLDYHGQGDAVQDELANSYTYCEVCVPSE
jgi:hypothetical protein